MKLSLDMRDCGEAKQPPMVADKFDRKRRSLQNTEESRSEEIADQTAEETKRKKDP